MIQYAEEMNLDVERLHRRITFLQDRAKAHNSRDTIPDKGCAATLLRDAGILTLIAGDAHRAILLFRKAGQQWADLGLFAGYLLQSFSEPKLDITQTEAIGPLTRLEETFEDEEYIERPSSRQDAAPFENASRTSSRQLLNLYQSMQGGRRRSQRARAIARNIEARLLSSASSMVGITGLPVRSYLSLFDRVGINEPSSRDRELLFSVMLRRDELLAAARTDKFHWQMVLRPAELVDLDLFALALNALEVGMNSEEAIFDSVRDRGLTAGLPFLLARDLRKAGDENSPISQ